MLIYGRVGGIPLLFQLVHCLGWYSVMTSVMDWCSEDHAMICKCLKFMVSFCPLRIGLV